MAIQSTATRFTLTLFALVAIYSAHGQVSGQVTDEAGMPVPHAEVRLLHPATQFVLRVEHTDLTGFYHIMPADTLATWLQVSAAGYNSEEQRWRTAITDTTINFILLRKETLGAVTVTGKKVLVEEKTDRTIFYVENSLAATGGDALDALKNTPGLVVMRNEVSIPGKGAAAVMINGRLQQLSGTDLMQFLQSIPAGNLARVEVIPNPPARYDAEGGAGLINLVLKKNIKDGLKGNTTASYQYASIGSPHMNTQLSYKTDRWIMSAGAGGGVAGEKYTNRTTSYLDAGRQERTFVQYERDNNASVRIDATYRINPRHSAGIQASELLNITNATSNGITNDYTAGMEPDSTIKTTGVLHDRSVGKHTLNLNYEWQIDTTGKKVNIDADYYSQHDERWRAYKYQAFSNAGSTATIPPDDMSARQAVMVRSVKVDVEWPLRVVNLSFGAKTSLVGNSSGNVYQLFSNNAFIYDAARSNDFRYSEQNQAGYASAQRTFHKLDAQAGIRAESSLIETFSPTTGIRNATNYFKFFPSAYLQYKINDKNVVGINYARRISRPGYNTLNPFRFYLGNNYYMTGNPNLRPSFTHGLEMTYRWKGMYGLRIFGRRTENYSDRIIVADTAGDAIVLTRANMGTVMSGGACVNIQHSITRWWDVRSSLTTIFQDYDLNLNNAPARLKDVYTWCDVSNTIYLNKEKTLSAELYMYYYTPRNKDYKKWSAMSTLDINIRWLLSHKDLVVALHLEDLMAKAYWQQKNIINGTSEFSYDNSRGGRISITYKFGNKNISLKDDTKVNEEIQRAMAQ